MNQNWIEDLIKEHQDVETPISWLYWSLVCCISSVAANAYTLRTLKGNLLYYPNIYVMLLGESGLGKGFPVNLAKRLVQAAEVTRVIAGRSSIQAIVKELATTKSERGKPLITDSRGFIVNGELSTAIIADPDSLTILTDLYDRNYNPLWTNMLKGDGQEKLSLILPAYLEAPLLTFMIRYHRPILKEATLGVILWYMRRRDQKTSTFLIVRKNPLTKIDLQTISSRPMFLI